MNLADGFAAQVLNRAREETQDWKMLINNEWVASRSGATMASVNPAYDEEIARVPAGGADDIELAVRAAKAAFPAWSRLHVDERAAYCRRFAQALRKEAREFGMLDAIDSGNPFLAMVDDAKKGASLHDFFSGLGMEIKGETIPTPGGGLDYTRLQPFGVVGRIIPFNHPISFGAGKLAPALIAGNTVVLKPADQTPLSSLWMGKLVRECFPPGVVNIVTGDGPACGGALVAHKDVRRIAFTGSVETGRAITRQAGIKTLSLELGGKNPLIIYPDVDIDKVAAAAVAGMNFTRSQGQSCGSNSRVFVHASIKNDFMDAVLALTDRIDIGLPELESTQMGPVVTRRHYERVMGYIETGRKEGARVVRGGGHAPGEALRKGCFVDVTVFDQVRHGMAIEREEIFGPVMSVLEWDDEATMLEEVNDSDYGLCANIWTNDISTGLRMADAVECGYVWVNGHGGKRYKGAPFGGFKNSGIGREHSLDELLSYTQVKNINVTY
ncbi:aldehyde dehydrogenase family protein [Pusillimonas caeni]|uniref:aldehyde dehydrogenase family protein n=1 Tax=Pusillimonas caeni TaxID=1348472 RepID=UPI000E59F226|nr:aldehyde dehydrogenase family protein [Pusillimonas caeni]TFL09387.1 aldehyde dehydrogenase family protein [Pusillimonas caeni]